MAIMAAQELRNEIKVKIREQLTAETEPKTVASLYDRLTDYSTDKIAHAVLDLLRDRELVRDIRGHVSLASSNTSEEV